MRDDYSIAYIRKPLVEASLARHRVGLDLHNMPTRRARLPDTRRRRVRDPAVWGRPVTLVWLRRRFACENNCGQRHLEVHDEFEGRLTRRMTRATASWRLTARTSCLGVLRELDAGDRIIAVTPADVVTLDAAGGRQRQRADCGMNERRSMDVPFVITSPQSLLAR